LDAVVEKGSSSQIDAVLDDEVGVSVAELNSQEPINKKQQRIIWRLQKENAKLKNKVKTLETKLEHTHVPLPLLTRATGNALFRQESERVVP
jgi:hypothetical protein